MSGIRQTGIEVEWFGFIIRDNGTEMKIEPDIVDDRHIEIYIDNGSIKKRVIRETLDNLGLKNFYELIDLARKDPQLIWNRFIGNDNHKTNGKFEIIWNGFRLLKENSRLSVSFHPSEKEGWVTILPERDLSAFDVIDDDIENFGVENFEQLMELAKNNPQELWDMVWGGEEEKFEKKEEE